MSRSTGERPRKLGRNNVVEIICVAVVLLAVIGLIVWIVTHACCGVLNQGVLSPAPIKGLFVS